MIVWGKDGPPKSGQKMTDEQFNIWKENKDKEYQDTFIRDRWIFVGCCVFVLILWGTFFHLILKAFNL